MLISMLPLMVSRGVVGDTVMNHAKEAMQVVNKTKMVRLVRRMILPFLENFFIILPPVHEG